MMVYGLGEIAVEVAAPDDFPKHICHHNVANKRGDRWFLSGTGCKNGADNCLDCPLPDCNWDAWDNSTGHRF